MTTHRHNLRLAVRGRAALRRGRRLTRRRRLGRRPFRRSRWARSRRRGVVLLMVLALLSLFLLIGMTMVMISGQAKRSARSAARAEKRLAASHEELLDAAMLQVVAGTNNAGSVLRSHSLLEDMYGNDGIVGTVSTDATFNIDGYLGEWPADPNLPPASAADLASGEFVCLTFNEFGPDLTPGRPGVNDNMDANTDFLPGMGGPDMAEAGWGGSDDTLVGIDGAPGVAGVDDDGDGVIDDAGIYTGAPAGGEVLAPGSDDYRIPLVEHYYAGRLITMTTGPSAGQTRRVVGSVVRKKVPGSAIDLPTPVITLIIRRFDGDRSVQPGPGDSFVINGRPFNGTGFGLSLAQLANYDPTVAVLQPPAAPAPGTQLDAYYTADAATPFILGAYDPKGPSPFEVPGADNTPFDDSLTSLGIKTAALAALNRTLAADQGVKGTWPYALLPNPAAFTPSLMRTPQAHGYGTTYAPSAATLPPNYSLYVDPTGPGGADEDYDAVDYQNMLLAMRRNLPIPAAGLNWLKYEPPIVEIPSLHRPDLISYWYTRLFSDIRQNSPLYGLATAPADNVIAELILNPISTRGPLASVPVHARNRLLLLKRKIMLRPLREDHPNFTGSNPYHENFDLSTYPFQFPGIGVAAGQFNFGNFARDAWEVSGVGRGNIGVNHSTPAVPATVVAPQWDVDNDNDGVGDSIWVDLGLPVQQTADGKAFKPLAAILCIDMDSKLNLNAHGNIGQIAVSAAPLPGTFAYNQNTAGTLRVAGGSGGQGYGSAEVNLGGVLSALGYDGRPGVAGVDDDGNGLVDDILEANAYGDDLVSMGFDGRPGRAFVDDDNDGIIDNASELGAAGSDDGSIFGPDLQPGIASTDDDRNGLVDRLGVVGTTNPPDMFEIGWLGSDDQFELARIFRGRVNPINTSQRLEGRYGEIWRNSPSVLGPGAFPPAPGMPNYNLTLASTTNGGWTLEARTLYNTGWLSGELGDVMRNVDLPTFLRMPWNGVAGATGVDDDGNGVVDELTIGGVIIPDFSEVGWPGTDDLDPVVWARNRPYYGTAPDIDGDGFFALDVRGQPLMLATLGATGVGEANERWDDPYELDLSANAPRAGIKDLAGVIVSRDSPFQPTEIESLLRANDLDVSSLPQRIALLAPTLAATPQYRNLVTSDSWDLPTPSLVVPPELLSTNDYGPETAYDATGNSTRRPGSLHFSDLVRNRLLREPTLGGWPGTPIGGTPAIDEAVNFFMTRLGYDIQSNRKLNLNVPFGNGMDDLVLDISPSMATAPAPARSRGNGIIDEPQEAGRAVNGQDDDLANGVDDAAELETAWFDQVGQAVLLDIDRDGSPSRDGGGAVVDTDEHLARQQYARQLYLLMMLLSRTAPQAAVNERFSVNMNGTTGVVDNQRELAQMIAQWAVNVVDYRDSDSIMTGFEYDEFPFRENGVVRPEDSWDVDGNLLTSESPMMPGDEFRGVVWGVERPELLITETLAFHDRRATDTDQDPSGKDIAGGDSNYDQDLAPKGVLMVELYNPGSTPNALPGKGAIEGVAPEFAPRTIDNAGVPLPALPYTGVQLNKMCGRTAQGFGDSPIWRMVVVHYDPNNPGEYLTHPDLEKSYGVVNGGANAKNGFRYIYFADPTGSATVTASHGASTVVFYPTAAANPERLVLPPRHYALVAPQNQPGNNEMQAANTVYVGNHTAGAGPGLFPVVYTLAPGNDFTTNSQVLSFASSIAGAVRAPLGDSGGLMWSDQIKSPLAVIIDSSDVTDPNATVPPQFMQMNISEPVSAYPQIDPMMMNKPRDMPFDQDSSIDHDGGATPALSFNTLFGTLDQTVDEYKLLLLQRLADPLEEFNAVSNPYLTVDSLPIPLTVFHGRDPKPSGWVDTDVRFESVQRGQTARSSMWSTEYKRPSDIPALLTPLLSTAAAPLNASTLGYANLTYTPGGAEPLATTATAHSVAAPRFTNTTVAGVNYLPFGATAPADLVANVTAREFIGDVWQDAPTSGITVPPFEEPSWLHWPNRPLISSHELLQVPVVSSAQLLAKPRDAMVMMNTVRQRGRTRNLQETAGMTADDVYNPFLPSPETIGKYPFADLMNFFESTSNSFNPGAPAPMPAPPEFHRILDFVHVPSKFAGTETLLNPKAGYFRADSNIVFAATDLNLTAHAAFSQVSSAGTVVAKGFNLAAPFNVVSEYREPGRINLNTMFDATVWRGMVNNLTGKLWSGGDGTGTDDGLGSDSKWQEFWRSRRGYSPDQADGQGGTWYSMTGDPAVSGLPGDLVSGNNQYFPAATDGAATRGLSTPTFFAKPFRAAGTEMLVPLESLRYPGALSPVTGNLPRWSIENGLLRPRSESDQATGGELRRLPLLADRDTAMFHATNENPAFRYELLQKLGNVATNRSNVYAVWITIGRFEVERAPREQYPWYSNSEFQQAFPDGYRLGKELGVDDGTVERHRAFYMFDRSLPMGFVRGEKLNTDNGILVRRIIE